MHENNSQNFVPNTNNLKSSNKFIYNDIHQIEEACYEYLDKNLVEGERWGMHYRFYKPSQTKYGPFQWLWDSGWHMIVNSYRNVEFSILDLRTMLQFQQPDGFIPEMIFWGANSKKSFLEKLANKFFGYSNEKYTDITQMPMLAYSLRAIWNATEDKSLLKEFLPKIAKYLEWWHFNRDPDHDGLVSIIHPWESGIDASPLYDPAHGVKKPNFFQLYPKFLKLLRTYKKKAHWDLKTILDKSWFNFEDVGVCSVYADGWSVLRDLAKSLDNDLSIKFEKYRKYYSDAILNKCWRKISKSRHRSDNAESPIRRQFISFYHKNGNGKEFASEVKTIQSLFPILLEDLSEEMLLSIIEDLQDPDHFGLPYPIPSTAKSEETFNPDQSRLLWRGPTWPSTVWIVMEGLLKHEQKKLAQHILDRWIQMYKKNGIWEYYNPITGKGLGEEGLGMSHTIVDMLYRLNYLQKKDKE
ncbi:MAG: MGH1-like glycoside hydrolase domain-containing protein [Promethearchaeota archaeon]